MTITHQRRAMLVLLVTSSIIISICMGLRQSLGLFMQMGGRIFRPWNGVTPLILDHGDNIDRHGMPHQDREWSLDQKVKKPSEAPSKV